MPKQFAHIQDGKVVNIIVAEQDFIDGLDNSSEWVQCANDDDSPTKSRVANIDDEYDSSRDEFVHNEHEERRGWTVNTTTNEYEPPVPLPDGGIDVGDDFVKPATVDTTDTLYKWDNDQYDETGDGWVEV
jgi:hypothetical protein